MQRSSLMPLYKINVILINISGIKHLKDRCINPIDVK